LSAHAAESGKQIRSLSEGAKRRLLTHAWPGNVRELENAIERAVVLCEGPLLDAEHLPLPAGPAAPRTSLQKLAALEREAIVAALEACNWSTARAAESLGVSVRTIQYRVGAYGLTERVREHARLRKERG
jgi:two-component system response regulator HydG